MEAILFILVFTLLLTVLASRYLFNRFRSRNFFYYQVLSILLISALALPLNGRVPEEVLTQTSPFVFLSMGWLGLYSGLFIGFQDFRRFSPTVWAYALSDSLLIFVLYFSAAFGVLYLITGNTGLCLTGASVLALGALEISPLAVSSLRHINPRNNSFGVFLQTLSGMSGIIMITMTGIMFPLITAQNLIDYGGSLLLQTAFGTGLGIIAVYAVHDLRHSREFMIWIIGILLLGSGMAMVFKYNAIYMNMITGMIVSTFSLRRDGLRKLLEPLEKPVFLFLLFFAGLTLRIHWGIILFAVIMLPLRVIFKVMAFRRFYGAGTAAAPGVKTLAPSIIPFGNISFTLGIYLLTVTGSEFASWILAALFVQYVVGFSVASFVIRSNPEPQP